MTDYDAVRCRTCGHAFRDDTGRDIHPESCPRHAYRPGARREPLFTPRESGAILAAVAAVAGVNGTVDPNQNRVD